MRTVFIECEYFLTKDKHRAVLEDMKHEAGDDVRIVLLAPGMHVAEPAPQWIPVSERLPDICEPDCYGNITFSENVLSCAKYEDGFYWVGNDQYTTNNGGGWLSCIPGDGGKVVAWMPLPEPYKEDNT